jgi:hypothetical protein
MRIRMSSFGVVGVLLSAVRCGEAELEVAEFAEVCGATAPVRVLELAEDQVANFPPRRVGGRLLFDVGRVEGKPTEQPLLPIADPQVWTTGLCGEEPVRLDERYRDVFVIDRWPDVVLVCDDENSRILSLAAEGPLDPHVVFPGVTCRSTWGAHGLLTPDWMGGLMFLRYPGDPRSEMAVATTLPGGVRMASIDPMIAATDDGVLVLRTDHQLVHFDLRDLSVTVVEQEVGDFVASPSGRYVLWKGVAPGDDVIGVVPQPMVLIDREAGTSVGLGEGYLSRQDSQTLRWADQGYVLPALTDRKQRIYRIPDLVNVAVPDGYELARITALRTADPLPDGRWLVRREQDSTLHYLEVDTGELTPMFTRAGTVLGREAGGTVVLGVGECCISGRADDEGAVWLVPDDGTKATRIAGRSTMFGGRQGEHAWISPVDLDGERGARLVRIDTATGEEQRVDDRVFAVFPWGVESESDTLRYSVQDGERSGVWQVRLR